ncbi:hypothetical protein M408DRAFT_331498 [Serendipita vermifera MAFF 305830]|uniref:AAA+ ATPase domain-containing protein n=2 Tax=Serendipita vermifera MAFF 305830 TaxID=933852 RepID=A0A0C2WF30_SERVB|nr:hypothetical protein M408DRAFT_331498 [Serendipita vermifera MAFF 305830]
MARTKQTARKSTAAANGTSTPKAPLGPAGTKTEYKRVDYLYNNETGSWIYRDSAPFTGQETDDGYRDYCFVIRKKYEYNSARSSTSIVIKSQVLRDVCASVIGVIPPVSFHTSEVDVNPRVLLTFYPALLSHHEELEVKMDDGSESSEEENTKVNQLGLLLEFLRTEYASELDELASLLEHDEITFDLLWAILIPNKEYYTTDSRTGQPRAVILKWATQQCSQATGPYFDLDCEYLESFGSAADDKSRSASSSKKQHNKKFGRARYNGTIYGFQGAVKITSLNIFPMEFHPRIDEARKMLIKRGKKWAAHDGKHHVAYSGIAFQNTQFGGTKRLYINGRAMIDKATFRRIKPNWSGMGLPKDSSGLNVRYDSDDEEEEEDEDGNRIVPAKSPAAPTEHQVLTDDELVLATPIVYGFALDDHQWAEFNIELVEEIVWNDAAFANLVLPQDKKSLVEALVTAHGAKDRSGGGFDDFIVGKGQGLVINLFGPPGVGKTMSAEATSEHLRKPLYVVGAGHLGTTASTLDSSLDEIFDIAHAWNAVVLIDEADVFLEERSVHDIHRNALVAVFLRQLEYFAGILFLTTNRVSTFDDAFQSRIHVALRYHDLDADTRAAIWKAFLTKVGAAETLSKQEWTALVSKKVNGRQIKNAVRTAQALAHSKNEELKFAHINQVLTVMDQFESDMKDLKSA